MVPQESDTFRIIDDDIGRMRRRMRFEQNFSYYPSMLDEGIEVQSVGKKPLSIDSIIFFPVSQHADNHA